jgi:hypothetical protein
VIAFPRLVNDLFEAIIELTGGLGTFDLPHSGS